MAGILLLVALLILHLSLYPWEFHAPAAQGGAAWVLLNSWPPLVGRRALFDAASNVVLYVPLGVFAYLALRRRLPGRAAAAAAVALGAALSAGIEMAQVYAPRRDCSAWDLAANTLGAAGGALLGLMLQPRLERRRGGWTIPAAGPVLLLCCFAGYQLYPVIPDTSLLWVGRKLRRLLQPGPFSLAALAVAACEWMAVRALAREAAGERRSALVVAALFALVPARLLVLGRTFTWPELAALPLALVTGRYVPPAAALAAGIVLYGLAPFQPAASPAAFQWIPFKSVVAAGREHIGPVVLLKIFRYGGLVWLLRAGGRYSFAAAAGATAALLVFVETAQRFVRGHVPETTDPVLAVLAALALAAAARKRVT